MSILCYATCYAEIPVKDMFVGVVVVLIGDDIFIDPTPPQLLTSSVKLTVGYLQSKKKMIHFEIEGKTTTHHI